jgi:hypothetical protein
MQRERRCTGDYLGWDYSLTDARIQRVFELATECFYPRNFAPGALANRLMATRFDVEMARHFHPRAYQPQWLERAKALSRALASDSVEALQQLIALARRDRTSVEEAALVTSLAARLRATERGLSAEAAALEHEVQATAFGARVCQRTSHELGTDPWGSP